MNKYEIAKIFNRMGEIALNDGKIIDIAVYGGSVLCWAFGIREATKDIDAVFEQSKDFIKKVSKELSKEFNLDENFINDAMKGYLSKIDNDEKFLFASYPSEDNVGLRVYVPTPEYMLALKCIDIRVSKEAKDVNDVRKIIKHLNFKTPDEVFNLLEKFYPINRLQPKTMYIIEEIVNDIANQPTVEINPNFINKLSDFRKEKGKKNEFK